MLKIWWRQGAWRHIFDFGSEISYGVKREVVGNGFCKAWWGKAPAWSITKSSLVKWVEMEKPASGTHVTARGHRYLPVGNRQERTRLWAQGGNFLLKAKDQPQHVLRRRNRTQNKYELPELCLNAALLLFSCLFWMCTVHFTKQAFTFCVIFLGKCQKEQRTLKLPWKLRLHLTSWRAPWEKICSVEPPGTNTTSVHKAQELPPLSGSGSMNKLCWGFNMIWLKKNFFFLHFPRHSTSWHQVLIMTLS